MRKYLILLGATLVGGVLFAQPRTIGVHPAHDGKLLTMCESATRKYYFGLLTGGQWCYATDLSKMKPQ